MGQSDSTDVNVDLLKATDLIHEHMTEALCQEVFEDVRQNERQSKWTFWAMAQFWTQVIIHAPKTLTQALEDCAQGRGHWPP